MKIAQMISAAAVAFLLTVTFGCGPAAPTNVDTSTSSSSNVTGAGENVTSGTDTPASESP